jgi:indole-3-glycerol phosphate synthase/phosphoribosylanthranilate isomerase
MGSATDIAELERLFDDGQPRVLIDAKAPGVAGGAGVRVDTELVELSAKLRPLWLAGGIDHLNAVGIIERFNPELIDISSGVEESPGKKDREKLKKLLSLAGRKH